MPSTTPPFASFQEFKDRRFFALLDGLRCISILAVIWHHTAAEYLDLMLSRKGHHGVTLFFAISGFLITTLLLRERDSHGEISLRAFYVRRSLRIFPLYYSVIALYVVLVLVVERGTARGDAFFDHLPAYLTYTSNWFVDLAEGGVIFFFAWSLAAEEQFYLVWPSVERFLSRFAVPFAALSIVVSQLALHSLLPGSLEGSFLATVLSSIQPAICFGVILAHALHREATFRALAAVLGRRWSAPATLLIVLLVAGNLDRMGGAGDPMLALMLALLVATCVLREDNWLAPALAWRLAVWTGKVSYCIYLMHMICANAVRKLLPSAASIPPVLFVATTILATLVATVSFNYYESYFLRLKKRFERS